MNPFQHTIKKTVTCKGVGLHSGKPVTLILKPAPANSGIRFHRVDLGDNAILPAFMDRVVDTRLATTLAEDDISVATGEHLLAAIAGLGIDNVTIEIDNSEVPIMDGSATLFVQALKKTGLQTQTTPRRLLKITREISYTDEDRSIRIIPCNSYKISASIDFKHSLIKKQNYDFEVTPDRFADEVASARTFGFSEEVEWLRQNGLALGGSLDNAVVVGPTGVLNKEGLRFKNEFVRHKILDIIGDLVLLGCPILGHVIANKSGHGQHLGLMQEIAATPDAWEYVELSISGTLSEMKKVDTSVKANESHFLSFLLPSTQTPAMVGSTCSTC